MNPTAIYSKSGKGVQEASGKTSLLKRPDRAVLSAIDGRATLAEVAQKVGKPFDADFQKLVTQMDKDGFIREVSPGAAPAGAKPAAPAAKAPPKPAAPAAPMDAASDLDFSSFAPTPAPRPAAPPPRPAAPPPRPAAPAAKAPPPKEQQNALNKAREEAEAKAQAERDRIKAETEAKMRTELEAKARAEAETKFKADAESKAKADAEAKVRADAESKIKAARDAAVRTAAEAKMKADAEAKRVREEADKAKRESEDLKQRLEEERKAREGAERKAKEEADRARRELEEERKRLEEKERKDEEERAARRKREEDEEKERRRKRDEEERKAEEERAARRKREEDEEKERQKKKDEERKRREEEDRKAEEERAARRKREEEEEERKAEEERAARRKKREEEEALARAMEEEERRIRAEEAEAARQKRAAEEEDRRKSEAQKSMAEMSAKPAAPAAPAKPAAGGGGFDSLLADLDSFGKKDEEEAKAKEEGDRKAKQEAARRAEEAARQEREEEERRASEERAAKRKRDAEEEERKADEERAAKRKKREEEDRREEEERKEEEKKRQEKEEAEAKKAKGKKAPAKPAADDDIPAGDDDMDDIKRDQRALAGRKKEKAYVAPPTFAPSTRRRPTNWGKPVAIGLILLLAVAVGVVHVMPLGTAEYERAVSEAIGRPVKISSGRMWLFTGLQLKLQGVTVGDNVKIASITAHPTFDSLSGEKKTFTRIDLEGVVMPQQALSEALFAKVKGEKFSVARVVAKQVDLNGPLALPKGLEADISFDGEGAARSITVRGPDTLVAKLTPKESSIEFEVNAGGFNIPIAPEVTLGTFGMKGTANRQGMSITEWDGTLLNGSLRGTANVRWGSNWTADGVITARGINAAVFVPALVSEGRAEGTAKFTMSGADPAALGTNGRYDGSFKIESGALGSVDLSLALKTSGRQTAGRTPFTDMSGQATFDRGAASVRNIQIGAGALNAGASVDITREGALSGRIVADVRAGSQTLRTTLNISGTTKDPQFRN